SANARGAPSDRRFPWRFWRWRGYVEGTLHFTLFRKGVAYVPFMVVKESAVLHDHDNHPGRVSVGALAQRLASRRTTTRPTASSESQRQDSSAHTPRSQGIGGTTPQGTLARPVCRQQDLSAHSSDPETTVGGSRPVCSSANLSDPG